jgi:hypothetical protein
MSLERERAYNLAIRQAQNLLRFRAEQMPDREVAYNQWAEDPRARGYREAADLIEALITPMAPDAGGD